jgi:phosphoribosyl-ATP pyrophosphohydrolase
MTVSICSSNGGILRENRPEKSLLRTFASMIVPGKGKMLFKEVSDLLFFLLVAKSQNIQLRKLGSSEVANSHKKATN